MSFILDALQRAESQRDRQPVARPTDHVLGDIAEPPPSSRPPWLIGTLIAATAAVSLLVLYTLKEPDTLTPAQYSASKSSATGPFARITPDTPLSDVATPVVREVRSLNREAARTTPVRITPEDVSVASQSPNIDSTDEVTPGTVSVSQEPLSASDTSPQILTNVSEEDLPSYQDLVLIRRIQMPEFHLDIHVYAPLPERRFVFVNNRKYREGGRLDEGGTVERITPEGAILNHRGHRFELVPD